MCKMAIDCNSRTLLLPGYYCSLNAETPTPTDNITGNICQPGHFCPPMSKYGTECPKGKLY